MLTRREFLGASALVAISPGDAAAYEMRLCQERELLERFDMIEPMKWAAEFCRRHPPATGVGAVAGSLVAYLIGVTRIDPVRHGLYFERFFNPARKQAPELMLAASARAVGSVAEPWGEASPVQLRPGICAWGMRSLDRPALPRGIHEYLDVPPGDGCREFIRRIQPQSLEDYALVMAIFRPGLVNRGIADEFLNRRLNTVSWQVSHPRLEPILADTYGVWAYQEQVMRAAIDIGGFNASEADGFRKAIGRKRVDELALWRHRFIRGGLPSVEAGKVYDELTQRGGFSFSRAHALAWADMSMRAAGLNAQ